MVDYQEVDQLTALGIAQADIKKAKVLLTPCCSCMLFCVSCFREGPFSPLAGGWGSELTEFVSCLPHAGCWILHCGLLGDGPKEGAACIGARQHWGHTHARTHARMHAHTHAHTHACRMGRSVAWMACSCDRWLTIHVVCTGLRAQPTGHHR